MNSSHIYKFRNIENNKIIFDRLSAPRQGSLDELKIYKFINDCEILEPVIKGQDFLDDQWEIRCYCGKLYNRKLHRLKYKTHPESCGCNKFIYNKIDWSNLTIKDCLILEPVDKSNDTCADFWKIKCHCGNIFEALPGNLKNGATSSCGCIREELSRNKMIEKHKQNRANKGLADNQYVSDINAFLRNTIFFLVRNIIKSLDGDICVTCSRKADHIHHIIPISAIEDYTNIDNFELVYDVNNLITLCSDCHEEAHNYNSKDINLKIQNELQQIASMRYISKSLNDKFLKIKNDINNILKNWLETLNV